MMESENRVRRASPDAANAEIDAALVDRIQEYERGDHEVLNRRLDELAHEWDIERVLELNASTLGLVGVGLAATLGKRWLILPGIVVSFLLQHAIQGWCPPIPVFRSLGFRTRSEIDEEKYALKALRGDFDRVAETQTAHTALKAVRA